MITVTHMRTVPSRLVIPCVVFQERKKRNTPDISTFACLSSIIPCYHVGLVSLWVKRTRYHNTNLIFFRLSWGCEALAKLGYTWTIFRLRLQWWHDGRYCDWVAAEIWVYDAFEFSWKLDTMIENAIWLSMTTRLYKLVHELISGFAIARGTALWHLQFFIIFILSSTSIQTFRLKSKNLTQPPIPYTQSIINYTKATNWVIIVDQIEHWISNPALIQIWKFESKDRSYQRPRSSNT